jgi:pyruvate,water dikinase
VRIPLAAGLDESLVGGKAANLSELALAGFEIPKGFCLTVKAYEGFLTINRLTEVIASELGRKPLETMRWEELWDLALRIRSAFSKGTLPEGLEEEIEAAVESLGPSQKLVLRSSAVGEDAPDKSFAGLHESFVGVTGTTDVVERVRQVWASLWSDAALLYRRELNLDPRQSQMAVIIQGLVARNRSGVAFGRDPRDPSLDRAIVEAVPGLCSNLVDGVIEPQTWKLHSSSGTILSGPKDIATHLLDASDLKRILQSLKRVKSHFGWAPDLEWTGRRERFTLLQARPITDRSAQEDDQRLWYLTLSPGSHRMKQLCEEVVNQLIPELEIEGTRLAGQDLEQLETIAVLEKIEERATLVSKWEQIYREKFIPFAHGVRRFGRYYNDIAKPDDPYEFVELLETERLLAYRRNKELVKLAQYLRGNRALLRSIDSILSTAKDAPVDSASGISSLLKVHNGTRFLEEFEAFVAEHGNLAYQDTYLKSRSDLFLKNILALARSTEKPEALEEQHHQKTERTRKLEQEFLQAVGSEGLQEALDLLRVARLSWRLRDDDNILMGRLEGQLLRAIDVGQARLKEMRVSNQQDVIHERLAETLEDLQVKRRKRRTDRSGKIKPRLAKGETPRQLVGQPAAPGIRSGKARCIRTLEDLSEFAAGEVLVCDSIQPTMTHLVPLAAGIVERRGGMLIHGAIIDRELGIPCVNGIQSAVELLQNGDLVSVDGFLGIVTVGKSTLDLELSDSPRSEI